MRTSGALPPLASSDNADQDEGCSTPTALEECPFASSTKASVTVRPAGATLVDHGTEDGMDDGILSLDTESKVEDTLLVGSESLPAAVSVVAAEGQAEDDDEEKAIGVSPDGRQVLKKFCNICSFNLKSMLLILVPSTFSKVLEI